ncbi:hypothetical protein O181_044770 [Austropuccinia psidii MF-1]|uniref:Uncharacterized protein n=1 Tax=Austropuccinia psidii MF-1 TaxID=1389203 RepID=A0A9Q3DQ34_9BASI|nr:hypothetical protein [Austropuccinia psidii MF-1]
MQLNGFRAGHSGHKSKRQEWKPRGEAHMEYARPSTSYQSLARTFDTLIESPEANITSIPIYRHNKLISLGEEVHGPRKDRGPFEGFDTHALQRKSPTDKRLVENPNHFVRGTEEEVGTRKGQQPCGSSSSLYKQVSISKSAKNEKKVPKSNQKGKKEAKGNAKTKWNRPYPQNYRIPKKKKAAMENVFNMERSLMEFNNKEKEKMNQSFPKE